MSSRELTLTSQESNEMVKALLGRLMAQQKRIEKLENCVQPASTQLLGVLIELSKGWVGYDSLQEVLREKGKVYEMDFIGMVAPFVDGIEEKKDE